MFKLQVADKRFKKYEWEGRGRIWIAKYEPGMEANIDESGVPVFYTQTTDGVAQFKLPSDKCYIAHMIMFKSYQRKDDEKAIVKLPYILSLFLTQNELDDMLQSGMLKR